MARASSSDYFHSMRFFVTATSTAGYNPLVYQAGFSAVSTPEASAEAVEYKEGHFIYTRKFPGNPTVSDITLSRGVVLQDTTFYDWMFKVIEGAGQYRTDLLIRHFHRDALPGTTGSNNPNATAIAPDSGPARIYHISEAFPIRCKIAGDLDATASDVSIAEMDVAYESFYITNVES
jgi:phage tail-like protein